MLRGSSGPPTLEKDVETPRSPAAILDVGSPMSPSPLAPSVYAAYLMDAAIAVFSILAYATCSVSMILLNKVMTNFFGLNHPPQLLCLQTAAGSVLGLAVHASGRTTIPLDVRLLGKWSGLAALFVAMLMTSILSLHVMSLAMYTLLKNGALFLTALGDVYFFERKLCIDQILAFVFMFYGSMLSGGDDRWVTTQGLIWTGLNVLCTASYNLYLKKVLIDNKELDGKWTVMFYNNTLSLPFLLPMAGFGWAEFLKDAAELPAVGMACLAAFVTAGALLSVTSLWCLQSTTPTTYTVVGATCKIPNIIIGAFLFSQFPTRRGILGIITAFLGIFLYTYSTMSAGARLRKKEKEGGSEEA